MKSEILEILKKHQHEIRYSAVADCCNELVISDDQFDDIAKEIDELSETISVFPTDEEIEKNAEYVNEGREGFIIGSKWVKGYFLNKIDLLLKAQIEECRYFAQRCARDYGMVSEQYDKWIAETPLINVHIPYRNLTAVDNTVWRQELRKINQLPQTQESLSSQLEKLRVIANKFGLYDAADFLKKE